MGMGMEIVKFKDITNVQKENEIQLNPETQKSDKVDKLFQPTDIKKILIKMILLLE